MKLIGDEMLNSGEVNSTEFTDNSIKFNSLKLNSLSEINLQTLPSNIIITENETKNIYIYNDSDDAAWVDWQFDRAARKRITLTSTNQFNYIHFLNDPTRYLEIDNLLLSGLDNNISFVIDWWMFQYTANSNGCLMYNGNQSAPNPTINKELSITTSGSIIDPVTLNVIPNVANDGYLNILYPPLKSTNKINNDLWHHCALVAKNGTIRLIIDAKVNSETQFDIIASVNNVLIGSGYINGIEAYIGKLRITKGTDLGWFDGGFDLPDNDYVVDANTSFLMDSTSLVDTTLNNDVTVHGTPLNVYQEDHYVYLKPSWMHNHIITFDFSSSTTVYLPYGTVGCGFELENVDSEVIIKDLCSQMNNDWLHFYSYAKFVKLQYDKVIGQWIGHSEMFSKLIPQSYLNSINSYDYYYMTFEGMLKNYGNGSVAVNPVQPILSEPSVPAINNKLDSKVINCNNGYMFNNGIYRSFTRIDTSEKVNYVLTFNVLFLSTLPQNWRFFQSNTNPTTNTFIYFSYNSNDHLYLDVYFKETSGAALIFTPRMNIPSLFSKWITIQLYSRLSGWNTHNVQFIVKDLKNNVIYYNNSAGFGWDTTTSYYIPNQFVAQNYLISDFNINIVT